MEFKVTIHFPENYNFKSVLCYEKFGDSDIMLDYG